MFSKPVVKSVTALEVVLLLTALGVAGYGGYRIQQENIAELQAVNRVLQQEVEQLQSERQQQQQAIQQLTQANETLKTNLAVLCQDRHSRVRIALEEAWTQLLESDFESQWKQICQPTTLTSGIVR